MRSDLIKKALKYKKDSRCTLLRDAYQPLNNICTGNTEHLLTDRVSLPILEDEDYKGAIAEQLFPKRFNGMVTTLSERAIPVEKNAINLYPKIFKISGKIHSPGSIICTTLDHHMDVKSIGLLMMKTKILLRLN